MLMDWSNPNVIVSRFFKVSELIYLPTWGRLADANDGLDERVKGELLRFARVSMDVVREFLGMPVIVHCWYRPRLYNFLPSINGATHSPHMVEGPWSACDFHVEGYETAAACLEIREILAPNLEMWGLRMEKIDGDWIHLDNRPPFPGQPRWFPV